MSQDESHSTENLVRSVEQVLREADSLIGKQICIRGYLLCYRWPREDRLYLHRKPGVSDRALRLKGIFDIRLESISYIVPYTGTEQYIEVDKHRSRYYFYPPSDFDPIYRRLYWKLNGWETPGPLRNVLKHYQGSFTREAILLDGSDVYEAMKKSEVGGWLMTPYNFKNLAIIEGTLEKSSLFPFRLRLTKLMGATAYRDKSASHLEAEAYTVTF